MNEKQRPPTSLGVAAPLWAELLKGRALPSEEAPPRPISPQRPSPPSAQKLSARRCQFRTQTDAAGQSLSIESALFNVKMQKYPVPSSLLPSTPSLHAILSLVSAYRAFVQPTSSSKAAFSTHYRQGAERRTGRGAGRALRPCAPRDLGSCPGSCLYKCMAWGESLSVWGLMSSSRSTSARSASCPMKEIIGIGFVQGLRRGRNRAPSLRELSACWKERSKQQL